MRGTLDYDYEEDGDDDHKGHRRPRGNRNMAIITRRRTIACIACLAGITALLLVIRLVASSKRSGAPYVPKELIESGYGYGGRITELRAKQFPQLGGANGAYLDYMGAGQYMRSQLENVTEDLTGNLYGNAHSPSQCSRRTEEKIDAVRDSVLAFFGTDRDHYQCVFTSGATGAIKTVGETFPWGPGSRFVLLRNNHNSVLGVREYALEHGGEFTAVTESEVDGGGGGGNGGSVFSCGAEKQGSTGYNLFAFPAEDNFDGSKFPVAKWTGAAHLSSSPSCRWKVLVDAAAFAPTNPLNLGSIMAARSRDAPDFVVVSFYKMFGYPTGLGALLVRNDALGVLEQPYWGGGQVRVALAEEHFRQPSFAPHERLEAGTLPFLGIVSVQYGLRALSSIGGPTAIQAHTWALTRHLYKGMAGLVHKGTDRRVCEIYGKHADAAANVQGAVVTFNVLYKNGTYHGFNDVLAEAQKYGSGGFHIRTGCMCNPGSCYGALGLSASEVMKFAHDYASVPCFNAVRIRNKPVGAVRVSIGYPTTFEEVHGFLEFIRNTFTE